MVSANVKCRLFERTISTYQKRVLYNIHGQLHLNRRSPSAWIPELIAAAGPEVTETYIDFFTPRSATEIPGLLTRGLAGSFLIGAPLMA